MQAVVNLQLYRKIVEQVACKTPSAIRSNLDVACRVFARPMNV